MWRKSAIVDAGGWQHDTLTEDLDLSYRAQLKGWKFVYRPDVVTPSELPEELSAVRAQQYRWAKGTVQTTRKLLADPGRVLRREHRGDSAPDLPLHRGDDRGGTVAGHRAGIAEAQVDVVVAIRTDCVGARGRLEEERDRPRPLDHPVHRDAVEEALASLVVEGPGPRVAVGEVRQLGVEKPPDERRLDAGRIAG